MDRSKLVVASFAILSIMAISTKTAVASSRVPQEAISKCISYAKSKGMKVSSSKTGRYIDFPDQFWIRVFGAKGKSKNVAATCDWTPKFGGKLTYDDELQYMDH